MATETAAPTHNHPEGIKGAVVTALAIFHLKNGKDKEHAISYSESFFTNVW